MPDPNLLARSVQTLKNMNLMSDYENLNAGNGFVELESRCFVRLTGNDRLSFFHNFCTNEIKQLAPGDVCEAFVLNTKGKILGFVHALAQENELLLTGHGSQSSSLISHLDKFLIREDVELVDVSQGFASLFICSDGSTRLSELTALPEKNKTATVTIGGAQVLVANIELAGFGFLLVCDKKNLDLIKTELGSAGLKSSSAEALNLVRVEQRTPWFGIDADDSNLPQELQRDEIAINFNKGCYLGQETVARIDARGRVNQLLVGLKFNDDAPRVGEELMVDEKSVGRVTSIAQTIDGGWIGLGYVRRNFKDPGTVVGNAVVR